VNLSGNNVILSSDPLCSLFSQLWMLTMKCADDCLGLELITNTD
jgi:hypothetical protein